MIITEQARRAIDYLRNAPESERTTGTAMDASGAACACAMLAKPLGIPVTQDTVTIYLVGSLSRAMIVPTNIMSQVPDWNDEMDFNNLTGKWQVRHSFAKIADMLEAAIERA